MAIRVYCEHGALRKELWGLQKKGIIEIINFPYEMSITKKHRLAKPSKMLWQDGNVKWSEANWTWNEMNGSEKLESIIKILGPGTRCDALHIDSAYKTGCTAFLTPDRKHITAKAQKLENLLGIRFFHTDDNWDDFLSYIGA